ncbi:MAG: Acg family FMN-binding oxidoreductase [Bacteroidales bacterium]
MKKIVLLKLLALTAIIVLTCACFTSKETNNPMKDKNETYKILHYASLAGSSHNSQPWKVEVYQNDSILIFADTSRLLDVVDPKGIELYISVGAFIENLDIAAKAYGYKTDITLFETGINSSLPAASIKLAKTGLHQNLEYLEELELRTTLRIPFDTMAIKNIDREKLVSIAPENIIFVPFNSPDGCFILKKELEAYTIQAYQKDAQDELVSWMRFSNKDVNSKRDGLTPAGMGIKGISGFIVRNFMKPEDSKKESFIKSGVEKTQKQVENCGGWIIISTEKEDASEWINIGRIYERINIQCRSLNLGFHPMNQIIEVPPIYQEVNDKILAGRKIRFVARIGYVDEYPAPVSKRRPVESFTIFK